MISSCTKLDINKFIDSKPLPYFSEDQLVGLEKAKVPAHIAIIPDGNRRWAKSRKFDISQGHQKGADNLITIVKAAKELGIKSIVFYLFSTENWLRDSVEVQALLWLMELFLVEQRQPMVQNNIKFHTIGNLNRFSDRIKRTIEETKTATADCNGIDMIAALNYGARDEITRSIKKLIDEFQEGRIVKEDITEHLITQYLDTAAWPDPELLIRTSGENRISNFLLWQISYSELYVADIFWPEFTPHHLLDAIRYYQNRDRRLGG